MLPEERRTQLDSIVQKMSQNNESDDSINFVVNDFKSKYSVKEPEESFLDKTANVLDMFFGGGKVGEAIGSSKAKSDAMSGKGVVEADYSKLSPSAIKRLEEKGVPTTLEGQRKETAGQITSPTVGQIAGSALQSASLFVPIGKVANVATKAIQTVGLKTGAKALGNIGAGALTGELFDIASNLQQGKTGASVLTPGWGTVLGGALPAAGYTAKFMVRFPEKQAPRVINSLIKPLAKDFSYGKNPGRAVAEEGIIANNFEDLIQGIRGRRQSIGQSIGQLGDNLSTEPILSIRNSLSPVDDAIKVAASQNNKSLVQRLADVKKALTEVLEPTMDDAGNLVITSKGSRDLDNITFKQVRNILGDVGDITQFTGNPSDDKLVNSALKQVYGKIKGASLDGARQINPELAKQFEKLTEKYADLQSAEIAAKYRDKILERQALIGFTPQTQGLAAGLLTAAATGGATLPAVLMGVGTAGLSKLMATPGFKTRLAFLMSARSRSEVNYLFKKIPALKEFFSTKKGLTPGDVILNKAGDVIETSKNIPNKQGGFVKNPLVKDGLKVRGEKPTTNPLNYNTPEEFIKAQGKPVYHGTTKDFTDFDLSKAGSATDSGMFGKGFYFTESKGEAYGYSKGTGNVKEVYLDMKNPLVINNAKDIPKIDVPNKTIADLKNSATNYSESFTKFLKEKGYDGVIDNMSAIKQSVVFEPSQIKTKSQLIDIWKKSQNQRNLEKQSVALKSSSESVSSQGVAGNTQNKIQTDPLIQEAKKYKSAEEFVKEQIPEQLSYLEKQAKGVSYETFKRNLTKNIGSVERGEKIPEDVAQSVFERLQKTAQRGEFSDEATLFKDLSGRNPKRLVGDETITVYRATPVNKLRAGDFVSPDKTEAGFYTSETKKIYPFKIKKSDLVSMEGSMGGGQELIYIPKGSKQGAAIEFYKSPRDFYEAVNQK